MPKPGGESAAGVTLLDARAVSFDRLAAYDRRFFPAPRDTFLSLWISSPGHIGLAALRERELLGLGVIRPCRSGHKIGPLQAASPDIAAALVNGLCAAVPSGTVVLDVPEMNRDAVKLAESMGLVPSFETARMYTGPTPEFERAGLYGITTFELG